MRPARERRIGPRVVGSMVAGAATAAVLVVLIFGGAVEPVLTGLALLGFTGGWALLALTTMPGATHASLTRTRTKRKRRSRQFST